jgi:hypothetical protein
VANPRYTFHVTKHFALRLAERNLSLENVKNVIYYSDRKQELRTGHHGGKIFKYFKTVDDKTLAVVAEIRRNDCWIATAYYEF